MNSFEKIILAIESAICGGSLSLIRDGVEITKRVGNSNISRAEDLLANIVAMLTENNISPGDLSLIAVSAGPGSFTGIRIGIATALGLKTGLGIDMASESALKAMAYTHLDSKSVIAALPVGRNAICLQSFQKSGGKVTTLDEPWILTDDEFAKLVNDNSDHTLILHTSLYTKVAPSPSIVDFGTNLAFAIGRVCGQNSDVVAKPLFISRTF